MPIRPREFDKPATLADALTLLRRKDVRASALLPGPRYPDAPLAEVEAVVDLSGLGLSYIKESDGQVQLGALTPLQDLVESPLIRRTADGLLCQAARAAAHLGLRRLGTVGGAVTAAGGPPDILLALLALDAGVTTYGATQREVPLAEFRPDPEALVTEVRFKAAAGARAALQRVARTPRDGSIVAVAALLVMEQGVCRHVRLAAGGAGARPGLIRSVEKTLTGQRLNPALIAAAAAAVEEAFSPTQDFRATAEYQRAMAGVLARRALTQAAL